MVIYNIKSKHFTLALDKNEDSWFAIRSGTARGLKIKAHINAVGFFPEGAYVTLEETTLRDNQSIEKYIDVLQDAAVFNDMIKNAEEIKPI